jgi:hypothetical protein
MVAINKHNSKLKNWNIEMPNAPYSNHVVANCKMRHCITFILLGLSFLCSAQIDKKVKKLNVIGVIIYRFIPDVKFDGYYCSLKPEIIIDTARFDFVSSSASNYTILEKNPEFSNILDIPENYLTNFETNLSIYKSQYCKDNFIKCDSILKEFKTHNIYDSAFYKPDFNEHMTLSIYSNSIFKIKNSDTICIAFSFIGSVIKYENVMFGDQTDYRIQTTDKETKIFDGSHSSCPFEKYNTTFIVLDKVDRFERINKSGIESLGLEFSELIKLKVFLYE